MISRARAVGWSIVYLGGGFAVGLTVLLGLPFLPFMAGHSGMAAMGIQSLILVAVFGLMTWLVGVKALRLTARELRLTPVNAGAGGFWTGLSAGAALAVAAMIVAVPAGQAAWQLDGGTASAWVRSVAVTGMALLPAAVAEELMFRGVPLVALSTAFGRVPAMLLLSVLFGLGHLMNPGIGLLSILNIALAGLWLGAAFFSRGGLWTATGAHLGWNLALAALAAPVSGLPLPMPWLDYATGGPAWLTGGTFGPEGGILASLCLGAGLYYYARRAEPENPT